MRIFVDIIKWIVDTINNIGQPKKSKAVQPAEVISAIKTKTNTDVKSAASNDFSTKKTENATKQYGTTGKMGKPGEPGKSGVSSIISNSTSSMGYYPQYTQYLAESIGTFDEIIDNLDKNVLAKIDDGVDTYVHQPRNIKTGFVVCGRRHHNCFTIKAMLQGVGRKDYKDKVQGFLTNKDRFVDRYEAAQIALASGQIKEPTERLYSEDVW